jgi:glutamate dehydrogenase/leucine dehydrogenase
VVTAKPLDKDGTEGRTEATGLGGFYILEKLAKTYNLNTEETTVAVQGIGNVGYHFARYARRSGFKIVAISDSKSAIFNTDGIDVVEASEYKEKTGGLKDFPRTENISNEKLLELDVDVLVPAAVESVITQENADKVRAKYIIEMANGPTTPEADEILEEKGIQVIPDILANAGGVTVSYFEWFQNMHGEKWTRNDVFEKLQGMMMSSFEEVLEAKLSYNVSFRKAAYIIAIDKIVKSMD